MSGTCAGDAGPEGEAARPEGGAAAATEYGAACIRQAARTAAGMALRMVCRSITVPFNRDSTKIAALSPLDESGAPIAEH
jgi:hypothetical protein